MKYDITAQVFSPKTGEPLAERIDALLERAGKL